MNYNVTICNICNGLMNFQQLREGIYWIPTCTDAELYWYLREGFDHRFAHRNCWKNLKEKRRELIRITCFKNHEPRSFGAKV